MLQVVMFQLFVPIDTRLLLPDFHKDVESLFSLPYNLYSWDQHGRNSLLARLIKDGYDKDI